MRPALYFLAVMGFASQAVAIPGLDANGSHFSELGQITPANVSQLQPAWQYRSGEASDPHYAGQKWSQVATPLLVGDGDQAQLLVCTPFNTIIALHPATGAELWRYNPQVSLNSSSPYRCRGLAYWQDETAVGQCSSRVFTATHDRRLIALDAHSGKPCDDFGDHGTIVLDKIDSATQPLGLITSSSPPAVIGDTVVVGSHVMDFEAADTPSGRVLAFDVRSGTPRWQFDAIPADTQAANAASWPAKPQAVSGAANVWAPMAVDGVNDILYLPTSSPSADFYGVSRPGDNRYANSLVALRGSSGELLWHFQFVHHDLWDYDTPAQPTLTDISINGTTIPAVVQVTKQGLVFMFNRLTGEPIHPIEERPVPTDGAVPGEQPWPTQPFPLRPAPLTRPALSPDDAWGFTPWDKGACADKIRHSRSQGLFTPIGTDRPTIMMPGSLGGPNWGGGAVWADQNIMLVNLSDTPFTSQLVPQSENAAELEHIVAAGSVMQVRMKGTPYDIEVGALLSPLGVPCVAPPWGKLVALNLASGERLWQQPLGSIADMGPVPLPFDINWGTPNLGGGLMTGTGVFFIGATMDRRLRAFDARSGEVLWQARLPAHAPARPMTYLYQGRQYLVQNAGGHAMFNHTLSDQILAWALPETKR